MIDKYVKNLIDNLPDDITKSKTPLVIDLVLDGGAFNGSYLIGALYFLKEMERRKYLKIERISGSSIGSFVAFLYFIDGLDIMSELYEIAIKEFRRTYKLEFIKNLKTLLGKRIPHDICRKVKGKLFITYNNIIKRKKIVKSSYKNVDDIINSIINSCFVPLLIDGNIMNKNKYMDGLNPYMFNKEANKKILHLDLFGYDKIGYVLNIKNEKTNYHRVIYGLLDIHSFFIKKSSTPMCSYVSDWTLYEFYFNRFKMMLERIIICLVYNIILLQKYFSKNFKYSVLPKLASKISEDVFIIMVEKYCL
jgi:hypothetical protein